MEKVIIIQVFCSNVRLPDNTFLSKGLRLVFKKKIDGQVVF